MTDRTRSTGQPLLSIRNLRKSYGDNEVLRGVSLDLHRGETVAILGASGSGKSTMLRCVNYLERPDGGSITLGGELLGCELSSRGLRMLGEGKISRQRQKTGMVFQSFNLFPHWTVLRNVIDAPIHVRGLDKGKARELGLRLLSRVGLEDRADSYPKHLSGGQQQRVSIARALAMEPELLLFDEPTSALDPANVGEVTSVMKQLADEGSTMMVVTHEVGFARAAASRVVVVANGSIVEDGHTEQVLQAPRSPITESFLENTLHR
ncbi:amino acid ABC transporter ATP-binding protein [Rhodococcus sp. IEGM 1409]|uniref:amino acid ABC transporter ATP-binding protein n=1 Tax=Rhodococcus sp. IEGM 1409 TaxID=3047082 RepID=UPI0024B64128|nr:amino acid ABC transporter ATP-binding protein [Rhodococcus sp. IEGM 1409]MDI9898755.1 amino acid ABC transporter ATP-binding protein [Rhodococcus sp. IEGM 1409]